MRIESSLSAGAKPSRLMMVLGGDLGMGETGHTNITCPRSRPNWRRSLDLRVGSRVKVKPLPGWGECPGGNRRLAAAVDARVCPRPEQVLGMDLCLTVDAAAGPSGAPGSAVR